MVALGATVSGMAFRRPFQVREFVEQFWFIASVTIRREGADDHQGPHARRRRDHRHPAMLTVTAARSDGRWQITALDTFTPG